MLSSSLHHTTDVRFSDLLRARLRGDFQTDSPAYRVSCTWAANPIIIERKLLRYTFSCSDPTENPFRTGWQAVVTTDNHRRGHALYAFVRKITDEVTAGRWPANRVVVLVEVHTIPGFHINWHRCWQKYSSSGALRKLCTFEIYINKYNITILNARATFI